ncbi:hypothetical protein Q5P01_004239 [Channa striata]|uniref:Uncharacterized protein n=1 Tax=Channa striata TaxID=64152 RepID=A0AA88T227_CHASR|nr:hypothetical protein Q5P01_004239 [Channa striata]
MEYKSKKKRKRKAAPHPGCQWVLQTLMQSKLYCSCCHTQMTEDRGLHGKDAKVEAVSVGFGFTQWRAHTLSHSRTA